MSQANTETVSQNTVNENAPLLQIRGLEVGFETQRGLVPAVRGVDLTLYSGQTLAIVGESGSGKTTTAQALIYLLAGYGRVPGGEVLSEARDLTKLSAMAIHAVRGKLHS